MSLDTTKLLCRVLSDLYASIDRVEQLERKVSDRDLQIVSRDAQLADRAAQIERVEDRDIQLRKCTKRVESFRVQLEKHHDNVEIQLAASVRRVESLRRRNRELLESTERQNDLIDRMIDPPTRPVYLPEYRYIISESKESE